MPATVTDRLNRLTAKPRSFVNKFKREEDGSIIVFTLFILVLMLIVSGMGVDFMRFEARRSALQGTVDRAVLAAADLDQTLDPAAVVRDYFDKAGMGSALKGEPTVAEDTNYRSVSAVGELDLDTFFLRLIGMETLTAVAKSTAIEGVGNIEVSLVVDISGSMEDPVLDSTGAATSTSKIGQLRSAATAFVNTLINDDTRDRVSLSFVPYSEHVNIGPDLYGQLTTTNDHGYSTCIELPASAYSTTAFNGAGTYQQVQHFQWNPAYDDYGNYAPTVSEPICPMFDFEEIVPLSQDAGDLISRISQLEPRGGTSIFLGLKWGVALLDPSIRPLLSGMGSEVIDDAFDARPVDYEDQNDPQSTKKYVVLMTDGQNSWSNRLFDWAYDDPSDIAHWASMNWTYFWARNYGYGSSSTYTYNQYTAELGDTYMQSVCNAAKDKGIIIYGIAMQSTAHGEDQMEQCASSPSHYYETSGSELTAIFQAIADQITDLRLTQ